MFSGLGVGKWYQSGREVTLGSFGRVGMAGVSGNEDSASIRELASYPLADWELFFSSAVFGNPVGQEYILW